MKIDIVTIFPEMYEGFLTTSIIKRAIDSKKVEISIHNLRNYSNDKHSKVDDYGIGGGKGMVLKIEPLVAAIEDLKNKNSKVILMTPQGVKYEQKLAYQLTNYQHLIIICGHYEGFDERIINFIDLEISIGDYILTGGEIPSMVVVDSVVRLIDGVIDEESHHFESFNDNLLDYPVYTKPLNFRGFEVPEILLSGHHKNINEWRLEKQIEKTKKNRPDLLEKR